MQPSAERQAEGAEGGDQRLRGARAADRIMGRGWEGESGQPPATEQRQPRLRRRVTCQRSPDQRAGLGHVPLSDLSETRAWSAELRPGTPGTLREKENLKKEALRARREDPRELGLQEFWSQFGASPPA